MVPVSVIFSDLGKVVDSVLSWYRALLPVIPRILTVV